MRERVVRLVSRKLIKYVQFGTTPLSTVSTREDTEIFHNMTRITGIYVILQIMARLVRTTTPKTCNKHSSAELQLIFKVLFNPQIPRFETLSIILFLLKYFLL